MARPKNPNGGKSSDKIMQHALLRALHREAAKELEIDGRPTKQLEVVAQSVVRAAMAGDMTAAKEIFDRVDGKVPNALPIDPNTGRPGRIVIGWINDDGPQMLAIEPSREE